MIELDNDTKVDFTIFKSQYDVTPIKNVTTDYSHFLQALVTPKVGKKESNGCFVGGVVTPTRNNEGTKNRSLLTFDFDDIPEDIHLFDHISNNWEYAFAMYSTHNHSPECHKFRLVIPLSHPVEITANQYKAMIRYISDNILDTPFIDPASYVISQVMHFPTTITPEYYFFDYVDEEIFNPDGLLQQLPDDGAAKPVTTDEWLDILDGMGEGGRNNAAARLSGHLLIHNIHPNVAYKMVELWNEQNSPPLEEKELVRTFESILKKEIARRKIYSM